MNPARSFGPALVYKLAGGEAGARLLSTSTGVIGRRRSPAPSWRRCFMKT